MKRFPLLLLLLLCAPIAPIARADDAADNAAAFADVAALGAADAAAAKADADAKAATAQLEAQLQEQSAQIEALIKAPAATNAALQKNIYDTLVAYTNRAKTNEKLKNWKDAAWDWYLADHMRFKLYYSEYDNASNSEAYFRAHQADDQIKAGDREGADRSMDDARDGKGWGSRDTNMSVIAARVNLFNNQPNEALTDALDAQNLGVKARLTRQQMRDVYVTLSQAYYQKGDLAQAEANWKEVLDIEKTFEKVKLFSLEAAQLNGAIARNPKDANAWRARADYYQDFAFKWASDKPGSWFLAEDTFANFKSSYGRFLDAAQRDYTRSLKLEPSPRALAERAYCLYQIQIAPDNQKGGVFPPTLKWKDDVDAAFELGADDFAAMNKLNALYRLIGTNEKAKTQSSRQRRVAAIVQSNFYGSVATLHNPENAGAPETRRIVTEFADALIKDTHKGKADATETFVTAEAWKNAGNAAKATGDLSRAMQCYQAALKLDPEYADAQNNIGATYGTVGDHRRAIDAFRAAIALAPQHRAAHMNLSVQLKRMGYYPEALDAAQDAVKFATPELKAGALDARANARFALKDRAGAIADWRAEVALDPKAVLAWQRLGVAALADYDIPGARDALQKAKELQSDAALPKVLLAIALNASALQDLAREQGKTLKELKYDESEKLRPVAQELLQNARLTQSEQEAMQSYWKEIIASPLGNGPEDRQLYYSMSSVYKAILLDK